MQREGYSARVRSLLDERGAEETSACQSALAKARWNALEKARWNALEKAMSNDVDSACEVLLGFGIPRWAGVNDHEHRVALVER
jgi:hypothetical protein